MYVCYKVEVIASL